MKAVDLTAYTRSEVGRTGTKKVRSVGRIPAVIYGRGVESQKLEIEGKALQNLIHHSASETKLVDLSISGDKREKRLVLLQEVQHHPLSGQILHVDLHEVAEDEKVTATVPVETVGEAVGVKTSGGVLEHVLFKVRVRALPRDLPELINVDVTELDLDQTLHISELPLPEGLEVLADSAIPVVSVATPRTSEDEELAPTEEGTGDVEMIKEKKDEAGGEVKASGGSEKK